MVIDLFGLARQRLRFWVDTLDTLPPRQRQADGDIDYSDETAQITSTAVDDVWSPGYVGLYRAAGGSSRCRPKARDFMANLRSERAILAIRGLRASCADRPRHSRCSGSFVA